MSHSFSVSGAVEGTTRSIADLTMLVMAGGEDRERFRKVGWIDVGLGLVELLQVSDGKCG
jgi:hypothetical protein